MLNVPFAGNGTTRTEFLELEKRPFGRAKNWTCKITVDLMESDCGDKACVRTLCWVFGKTNTYQDTCGAAIYYVYGARTKIIYHCQSNYVGPLVNVKLIINK